MTNRHVRKLVRSEVRDMIRPRPLWCPRWVYALACRLVLRTLPMSETP